MQEPTTEHQIELFDAPFERLRLDMPSTIDPVHIGGFADAVQGADSVPVFWAAVGRYASALGLRVIHGDAIETERVAFATLSRATTLREQAAQGSQDALDQLVELAAERGDLDELRRLADGGSTDALDQLIELAVEREDLDELRRLADAGSVTAREVLEELTEG